MSLLDPKVANLQTQLSHTTNTLFKTSVRLPAQHNITGLKVEDLQKSAASEMRESLRKHLGRNVRVFVDFWREQPKGKGKGKVQCVHMVSARVVWW